MLKSLPSIYTFIGILLPINDDQRGDVKGKSETPQKDTFNMTT